MRDSNGTASGDGQDYLLMILAKTRNDKQLAFTIFAQLFAELPEQLEGIQNALNRRQYDLAREITHKLHGSLSFCGLENIRRRAHNLERSLDDSELGAISRYWFQLQQGIFDFTDQQQALLEALSEEKALPPLE
jgi:HPt (histidine-containing phosphotransfer) domain-containing protein